MLRVSHLLRTQAISGHLRQAPKVMTCMTSNRRRSTKAVIFDMGGVLVSSPFGVFQEYENQNGLPARTIAQTVVSSGDSGAWVRMERGDFTAQEFAKHFTEDVFKQTGQRHDFTKLMPIFDKLKVDGLVQVFPEMVDAIKCIRAEGIKTALLTNNWLSNDNQTHLLVNNSLFDVVVESCKVKMRKPDPRIYQMTLDQLEVKPEEAVFLDDLGMNLKPAKEMGIRTIKVNNTEQALQELQEEVGFALSGYMDGTTSVPERLKINVKKLKSYLDWALKVQDQKIKEDPVIRCYEHGQSNPTYFVRYAGKNMVLRKKPPGKLLPSAHAVEREYRVMKAVGEQGVPTPVMLGLCEDEEVIGTPFYIMEHVQGRIFKDPLLPDQTPEERKAIYTAMCDVLAKIHKVDIEKAQLKDYGKIGHFVQRNFNRWKRQFEASKTHEIPAIDSLSEWLLKRMPQNEKTTVVHGDFRLDNLIYHPDRPEVVAVLDWELSTLGDPLTDLATNCMPYYLPPSGGNFSGFGGVDFKTLGLPTKEEYVREYMDFLGDASSPNIDFYLTFVCFRFAAILQGVYKRYTQGQASSSTAKQAGLLAEGVAGLGWEIAKNSDIPPNPTSGGSGGGSGAPSSGSSRNYSTQAGGGRPAGSMAYSTSRDREIPGTLPLSASALEPRARDLYNQVRGFMDEHVYPFEPELKDWVLEPKTKWTIHPKLEELKAKAKAQGLWNLFLPKDSDPQGKYGAGLTNVEYAYMCEEMGRSGVGAEVFNCSAPDTGNMEVLIRYGTEEQKETWLKPLLNGDIRSCFGMTEPAVASSDATNIQASIRRNGDHYVINGQKWWTSGANDPRCKVCIFMGKTDPGAARHQQQSMILVPMDAPGVKILRNLSVFGYDDAPHGHAEVLFEDVKVPLGNMLLGEGRGFEIAQGRLGPGRIHHCMRLIGLAERSLELMVDRVQNRVAFGKPLATQSSIQQDIAKSRIEIDQCRLLVLKAAHMMDTVGNKVAAPEIAMIKVAAPNMAQQVVDRAIQAHGGMGVCQDTPLGWFYAAGRSIRLADGPDEVHCRQIAKMTIRMANTPSPKL